MPPAPKRPAAAALCAALILACPGLPCWQAAAGILREGAGARKPAASGVSPSSGREPQARSSGILSRPQDDPGSFSVAAESSDFPIADTFPLRPLPAPPGEIKEGPSPGAAAAAEPGVAAEAAGSRPAVSAQADVKPAEARQGLMSSAAGLARSLLGRDPARIGEASGTDALPAAGAEAAPGRGIASVQASPFLTRRSSRFLLRAVDIAVGGAGTLALLAALVPVALAVKASGPGPVFYKQARMGHAGVTFTMWKFRSMRVRAPGEPLSHVSHNLYDPRITRAGRFLRRWKIDEWPQFAQVLLGRMTLVGLRPLAVDPGLEEDANADPAYLALTLYLKPALTEPYYFNTGGLGAGTPSDLEARIQADLHYVRHASWKLYGRALLSLILSLRSGERADPPRGPASRR